MGAENVKSTEGIENLPVGVEAPPNCPLTHILVVMKM